MCNPGKRVALIIVLIGSIGVVAAARQSTRGPDDYFRGEVWTGAPGITETVGQIQAREAAAPPLQRVEKPRHVHVNPNRRLTSDAPAASRWPLAGRTPAIDRQPEPKNPQAIGTNWAAIHASESGAVPPDSMGAAGPTQIMTLANGRFKVFDKAGTLGPLNVSDSTFFASVRGSDGISDPHVRYDRLSGRWFITEITLESSSNRIMIAVSSDSTISSTSSFTFFQFQHDAVGTVPNPDTGQSADYDTLGVDANALYIGINEFDTMDNFRNTTGYVVNKANLLAGTLTVTAFRALIDSTTHVGPYTPQGVDNDDPSSTEGYFIGVDNAFFSSLILRRITNPGGTPSISENIILTVPTTYFPIFGQVQQGTTQTLDAIDDRLFAAKITKNQLTGVSSLWTAHNIRVNSSGVGDPMGDRNAMRWYQIDSLTSTPTLTQSGTLFDSAGSNPTGYWMGSVAASSQGHMALIASFAGNTSYAGVTAAGRLSGDTLGTIQPATVVVNGAGPYIDFTGSSTERWGDYSQVTVDPADGQTMWAFAEYSFSSTSNTVDAWGVRAVKLLAPPPAALTSASPPSVPPGQTSADVTITGTSSSGSAFFEPGSGFPNHLSATVGGSVTVNSVTFLSETSIRLNISTIGAASGPQNVTVTNPDGQQSFATGLIRIGFTDDPLVAGVTIIKAIHITELRNRIDALRTARNLGPYSWTDATITPGSTIVLAQHVTEMRTALAEAYAASNRTPPGYTDQPLAAGMITKAVHIKELRDAVVALE
jgi:hypothetical protein